jgi:hypothetical protein
MSDSNDFTGLPIPADVQAAFSQAGGADEAKAWLAGCGVSYADAKMIAVDDEAPDDVFRITNGEPEWIAIPTYTGEEFIDLVLMHRSNKKAFHTVCENADWLGGDNTSNAKVIIHENPVDWLADGCRGVVSVAGMGHRQHYKDLAKACTIECSRVETAHEAWTWTFGDEPKALKRIQIKGDPTISGNRSPGRPRMPPNGARATGGAWQAGPAHSAVTLEAEAGSCRNGWWLEPGDWSRYLQFGTVDAELCNHEVDSAAAFQIESAATGVKRLVKCVHVSFGAAAGRLYLISFIQPHFDRILNISCRDSLNIDGPSARQRSKVFHYVSRCV